MQEKKAVWYCNYDISSIVHVNQKTWGALALMNNSGHWEEAIRRWPNTSLVPSISVSEGSPGNGSILLKEPTEDTFDLQAKVALK